MHLRRWLVCGGSFIVAIERRSVRFVDELVSLLGPLNRTLYVFLVYLLSGHELPQPCGRPGRSDTVGAAAPADTSR